MMSRIPLLTLIVVLSATVQSFASFTNADPGQDDATQKAQIFVPSLSGTFRHIYDPNEKRKPVNGLRWYTNDHTFVFGSDSMWHAYGIIGWGRFGKGKKSDVDPWRRETAFFHISSRNIDDLHWEDHAYALTAEKGIERVLWAPHVIRAFGRYFMFYNTGTMFPNADSYPCYGNLRKASSTDMYHWTKDKLNPLFSDPGPARDSYIFHYKTTYYYYYCRTKGELDTTSAVAVRTSDDLDHWSGPKIVHEEPAFGHWAGNTESPTVIYYKGLFYLFICYASDYNKTLVYWSADPTNFPSANLVTTLNAHALEVVDAGSKGWYISNTGWDKEGLYLGKMTWEKAKNP